MFLCDNSWVGISALAGIKWTSLHRSPTTLKRPSVHRFATATLSVSCATTSVLREIWTQVEDMEIFVTGNVKSEHGWVSFVHRENEEKTEETIAKRQDWTTLLSLYMLSVIFPSVQYRL